MKVKSSFKLISFESQVFKWIIYLGCTLKKTTFKSTYHFKAMPFVSIAHYAKKKKKKTQFHNLTGLKLTHLINQHRCILCMTPLGFQHLNWTIVWNETHHLPAGHTLKQQQR